jgi:glycosyltransferase involved in cell wall biosynthesis
MAIATDIGDARVVVGNTGTVVPRRAPEPIVDALKRIAELPKPERRAGGSEARRHIVENFDLAAIARRYARLYDTA